MRIRLSSLLGGVAAMLLAMACFQSLHATLQPPGAPPEIRIACELAEIKCTRCHTLGRLLSHRDADWDIVVSRMRRIPGNSITEDDGRRIVSCLNYPEVRTGSIGDRQAPQGLNRFRSSP